MPFVLPPSFIDSLDMTFVLAYGRLSALEICSVLGTPVEKVEAPSERVAVVKLQTPVSNRITRLAGVHKVAPLMGEVRDDGEGMRGLVQKVADQLDDKSNVSLSGYDIADDDYEALIRDFLGEVRTAGFRKAHLLRPKGNELLAEQVVSRKAVDIVAFPYHGAFGAGPTSWVPDSVSMRRRGTQKPIPHSDISMSPRLARVLLNLAGLTEGMTVLDPFCGSGTILAEAFIRSIRCLGLDSRASRVQEARENLGWLSGGFKEAGYDIRKGDARDLVRMLRRTRVDAVVTEPFLLPRLEGRPRTSTASQLTKEAAVVYEEALGSMARVLVPGGRVVIVVPVIQTMEDEEVSITLDGRKLGLKLYQPGPVGFEYPIRLSFESTRWIKRGVYVFESAD